MKAVSGKGQQRPTTKSAVNNGSSLRQQRLTAAAYNNDGSGLRQWQTTATTTTAAVVAYNKKGTMVYINGRLWQQPTTVATAAYIDGRQRQWPTPTTAVLIMNRRGGRWEGRGANARAGEG